MSVPKENVRIFRYKKNKQLKHTIMKTADIKISKSAAMSRAWKIFKRNRDMFPTFSEALTRAWADKLV